jgi:hypothetical protein
VDLFSFQLNAAFVKAMLLNQCVALLNQALLASVQAKFDPQLCP